MKTVHVEPYSGGWTTVSSGQYIRITDVEGVQIADMFAVSSADMTEWLSAGHTRCANRRLFPAPGQEFFTNRFRPIMTFVADHSPGVHDMLWRACDPLLYQRYGVEGYHPSCNENFRINADQFGWQPTEVPDPVDWFQNTPVIDNIDIGGAACVTTAGDHVVLRAEMDLHLIVTSCSMDLGPKFINGPTCTPIRVDVADTPDFG
ncbi:MAG: DUF1989 domain-containing protein [Ilumatobacteraceae bacterium]